MDAGEGAVLWSISEGCDQGQPDAVAGRRWEEGRGAGLTNIKFGWMGGAARGEPHYYRIQAPDFLIEYDNTQNGANHVHCVSRDLKNDFGDDRRRQHYEQHHTK